MFASRQPPDVLEVKAGWKMQPGQVTMVGSVLSTCNLKRGGRGTRACKVCALWHIRLYVVFCNPQEVRSMVETWQRPV